MRRSIFMAAAAVVAAMGLNAAHAAGATAYFVGGSTVGNTGLGTTSWSDADNWQGGYVPVDGDAVVFQSRSSGANSYNWVRVTLGAPRVVDSLDIATVLGIDGGSNTFTITSGNLIRRPTSGAVDLFAPIVIGADGVWIHEGTQNEASALNINGALTGDASLELRGNTGWNGSNVYARYGVGGSISLTGAGHGLSVTSGAELYMNYTAAEGGRLADTMPLRLSNGTLNLNGASNVASTETIGALTLSGRNFITLTRNGSGTASVDAASLTRADRATLSIRTGSGLGTNAMFHVAGGIPMTNGMIAPWLVTATSTGAQADVSYATYDNTQGVVPLAFTARTDADINSAASSEIVSLTKGADQPALTGDLTIQALKVSGAMTLGGTGTLTISSGGLIARAGTQTLNVPVAFGDEAVIYSTDSGGYTILNLNGAVSGTNGLTVFGGSEVNLGANTNTFTGPITINQGRLKIGGTTALTDGTGLTRAGGVVLPVNVGAGGEFALNGRSQRIGGLDGSGRITNNSAANTLYVVRDNTAVSTYAGSIAGDALNFTKQGNGTQILSGALTYGGATTISDGTLQVDGTLAAGGAAVTVDADGILGGNGSVLRDVVANGAIAPGASVGSLTVSSLALQSGSVLDWEVGDAGTDWLSVTGLLSLTGPTTLNITQAGTLSDGVYTLIDYGSLSGDLDSIAFGATPAGHGYSLQLDSNHLNLVVGAVPEPTSLALLAMPVPALALRRRRQA